MKIDDIIIKFTPLIEWVCDRKYKLQDADKKDVRQEVVINLLKYKDYLENTTYEKIKSFVGYSTNYKCINFIKKESYIETRTPKFFHRFEAPPELLGDDTQKLLKLLLNLTSSKNGRLLEDYYIKKKTLKELSKSYRIKEQTLYRRIHRALKDIKDKTNFILQEFSH